MRTSGQCRACAFDGMGDTYDQKIGWDEFVLGINLLRWSLLSRAKGDVRLRWTESVMVIPCAASGLGSMCAAARF